MCVFQFQNSRYLEVCRAPFELRILFSIFSFLSWWNLFRTAVASFKIFQMSHWHTSFDSKWHTGRCDSSGDSSCDSLLDSSCAPLRLRLCATASSTRLIDLWSEIALTWSTNTFGCFLSFHVFTRTLFTLALSDCASRTFAFFGLGWPSVYKRKTLKCCGTSRVPNLFVRIILDFAHMHAQNSCAHARNSVHTCTWNLNAIYHTETQAKSLKITFQLDDLDLWPMTLTFKLVQDVIKINPCTKFQDSTPNGSTVRALTDRQTDTRAAPFL